MSAMQVPKVLVLSSSVFNHRTGGGVTLSNLFHGWPKERIATVHSDTEIPSRDICENYFLLSERELGRSGVFGMLRRGPLDRAALSPALASWVADFAPEVIYTLLGSLGYVRLATRIADTSRAALVPHMMDDWPVTAHGPALAGWWMRARLDRELRELFARSQGRLAISPSMAVEYGSRYGHSFTSISNPVEPERWHSSGPRKKEGASILLYVGSVLPGVQMEALGEIAAAADKLMVAGRTVRIVIATPSYTSAVVQAFFQRFRSVLLQDAPTEDAITGLVGAADLLLLPANFNSTTVRYLRLSNPTKIPAYMASGIPIFAYAPLELDMMQRAVNDGWAIIAQSEATRPLHEAIASALDDGVLRSNAVSRALSAAQRDHDANVVRAKFREFLVSAAAGQGRAGFIS